MNHLNFFNPFSNHDISHEDVLTRNYLLLVKNIPSVQIKLLEQINSDLKKKNIDINVNSLKIKDVQTQVDSGSNELLNIINTNILSIIISDDAFEEEHEVTESERHARYDGVVFCESSYLFIIENKPSRNNIWSGQLNPNYKLIKNNNLIDTPCSLSWRNVIEGLSELLIKEELTMIEEVLISDFLEYVDSTYVKLNPFKKFGICKNNKYLIQKRCNSALTNIFTDQEIKYHRGWKYYVDTNRNDIKKIALSFEQEQDFWQVSLYLYAADTQSGGKDTFSHINPTKANELSMISGFSIKPNFHIAFMNTNLQHFISQRSIHEYINYWKDNQTKIKQIKVEQITNYLKELINEGIIQEDEYNYFEENILSKKYQKFNICPGIEFKYSWSADVAIELDSEGQFENDVHEKIVQIFNVFEAGTPSDRKSKKVTPTKKVCTKTTSMSSYWKYFYDDISNKVLSKPTFKYLKEQTIPTYLTSDKIDGIHIFYQKVPQKNSVKAAIQFEGKYNKEIFASIERNKEVMTQNCKHTLVWKNKNNNSLIEIWLEKSPEKETNWEEIKQFYLTETDTLFEIINLIPNKYLTKLKKQ